MITLVLETVTTHHKEDNCPLSAALELFVDCIVGRSYSAPKTPYTAEAAIDNLKNIAPRAALVRSDQHNYTEERANIEERC